jgi:KDO2-lipid IV(A) lauroyltransferase
MLALWRALKQGEIVLLGADRDVTGNGRPVEFFGTPTSLPEGPVRLALRSGAALIPVFSRRLPDDTVLIEVDPPLELEQAGDTDENIEHGLRELATVMERRLARHPDQWLVAAPIWPADSFAC